MEALENRITIFRELLGSISKVAMTVYDRDFHVVSSDSPHLDLFHLFFSLDKTDEMLTSENAEGENAISKPGIFSNTIGMSWISEVYYEDRRVHRIFLLGPVFLDDYSISHIEHRLNIAQIPMQLKYKFLDIIKEIPVMPLNRFYEQGIMLHCAITGERISVSDFLYADLRSDVPDENLERKQSNGAYIIESRILKLVEEGNLGYAKVKDQLIFSNQLGKLADGDHVRQAKNTVILFCTLCASAAVKGGLAPETAYYLRQEYIRMVEAAPNLAKVNEINHNMLDDFVRRVHRTKVNDGISPQIKQSCDYICLHLEEKIDIHTLASQLGYTDYYFSNKFKKEVGMSVRDYTMKKKVEKAKELLRAGNMDIQDISDALGYGSQSYFGEVFRRETGLTPGEFRSRERSE